MTKEHTVKTENCTDKVVWRDAHKIQVGNTTYSIYNPNIFWHAHMYQDDRLDRCGDEYARKRFSFRYKYGINYETKLTDKPFEYKEEDYGYEYRIVSYKHLIKSSYKHLKQDRRIEELTPIEEKKSS